MIKRRVRHPKIRTSIGDLSTGEIEDEGFFYHRIP